MVSTLYLHQNGFETGAVIVFDSKGFTLSHLAKFNFSALKHAVDHLQEGAPVRVKSVHFINVVPVLDKVMSLIKPLLRGEVFNMVKLKSRAVEILTCFRSYNYIRLWNRSTNTYRRNACLKTTEGGFRRARSYKVGTNNRNSVTTSGCSRRKFGKLSEELRFFPMAWVAKGRRDEASRKVCQFLRDRRDFQKIEYWLGSAF